MKAVSMPWPNVSFGHSAAIFLALKFFTSNVAIAEPCVLSLIMTRKIFLKPDDVSSGDDEYELIIGIPALARIGSATVETPLSTFPKYANRWLLVETCVAIEAPVDGLEPSSYGPRIFTLQPFNAPALKPPALLNVLTASFNPSFCSCP